MNDLYLSTGKAARSLGVNAEAIRRLCEAGAIQAETTAGGQWRISVDEVQRLKEEGMPALPKPLPGQSKRTPIGQPASTVTDPHSTLLADPSDETIAAADAVVRLENEVRALALKRQREEALDWFRNRENEEDAEAAELADEEEGLRAEEEDRERRRRSRTVGWSMPWPLSPVTRMGKSSWKSTAR